MYNVIKLTRRTLGDVRVPTVQQYSNVMIPVKKDEGLFVNHNKECVDQFTEANKRVSRTKGEKSAVHAMYTDIVYST